MTPSNRFFICLAAAAISPAAIAADLRVDGQFISDATSGPPIQVNSSELVPGLNAQLLDGKSAAEFQHNLQQTIVVSPTGDSAIDGATLANTVNTISDATRSSPVLVWIEPGTYKLDQTLSVQSHVYLKGAGQGATRITRTGDLDTASFTLMDLSDRSVVSHLTLLGFGGGSDEITGVRFNDAGQARLHHVTVEVQNANVRNHPVEAGYSNTGTSTLFVSEATVSASGGDTARGIQAPFEATLEIRASTISATGAGTGSAGVRARGTESRLTDSEVTSDGTGIYSDSANLTVRNSSIYGEATGAAGQVEIFDSRVEGVTNRALSELGGTTTSAAGSQLIGTVVATNCVANYDGGYNFHATSCP